MPFCIVMTLIARSSFALPLVVAETGGRTDFRLGDGPVFYSTTDAVTSTNFIEVASASVVLMTWNQQAASGPVAPWYSISLDGLTVAVTREASYALPLRFQQFDPLSGSPSVPSSLTSS